MGSPTEPDVQKFSGRRRNFDPTVQSSTIDGFVVGDRSARTEPLGYQPRPFHSARRQPGNHRGGSRLGERKVTFRKSLIVGMSGNSPA